MADTYLTEEGKKALTNRVRSLCEIFNKGEFPFNEMMLGFGKLDIENSDECLGRIKELCEMTGFQVELEKRDDGTGEKRYLRY